MYVNMRVESRLISQVSFMAHLMFTFMFARLSMRKEA